ncbi:PaaX domain-containing protein, C- domain protein [Nocardioides humilatus]|uniref:PaaX domain-containing protein, C-domain protein n=1 Tax=Nocardioides humilatus TaxID=2607660 RepID=A0A5B1LPL2_9ACTN|nr:PaaX domain-containing protein, C- domain protein [Nocardioides humilatus]KAA1421978.1 PaaX domain-containing protein, C- domain protein [Nocardioides humilatus]
MSTLKPVSARSTLLSLLLGADSPSLSARELVATASVVGVSEPTVRVALSRMAGAGDVVRDEEGRFALSDRLLARQLRQEASIRPRTIAWRGRWDMVVVTATGRSAAERAELRTALTDLRLAELREGVWTRPANLRLELPAGVDAVVERFVASPAAEASDLVARLWDLDGWARRGRALLEATRTDDVVVRFTACATSVSHLLKDPLLPTELLPADWPADELREAHLASRVWINELRGDLR